MLTFDIYCTVFIALKRAIKLFNFDFLITNDKIKLNLNTD